MKNCCAKKCKKNIEICFNLCYIKSHIFSDRGTSAQFCCNRAGVDRFCANTERAILGKCSTLIGTKLNGSVKGKRDCTGATHISEPRHSEKSGNSGHFGQFLENIQRWTRGPQIGMKLNGRGI